MKLERSACVAAVLAASTLCLLATGAGARLRERYTMVTHACGAVESFLPIENLVVVGFAPGAAEDADFELAQSEGLLVRSTPAAAARDGAALYALPPGEPLAGSIERLLLHEEVTAVMPGLVLEAGAKAVFLHPGAFTATIAARTAEQRAQVIERLRAETGLESAPFTPRLPQLGSREHPARPLSQPPNQIRVQVPRGGDLFDALLRAGQVEGVLGTGVIEVKSTLSMHNDSYRVRGAWRPAWYVERTFDGAQVVEVRQDYRMLDNRLLVEFRSPPPPAAVSELLAHYGLRAAHAEVQRYDELPDALAGRIGVLEAPGGAAELCARLVQENPDLVRGALPACLKPLRELQTAFYFRPRSFTIEFKPEATATEIKLTLKKRDLREVARRHDQELNVLVVDVDLPGGAMLFPSIRGVREDLWVANARPQIALRDNEVQLRAGHTYGREPPALAYTDQAGEAVRLYPLDRLLVLTFPAAMSAGERQALAARFDLRLMAVRQNLNLRDRHEVYGVGAGQRAPAVAAAIGAAAGQQGPDLGAAAVLLDAGTGHLVFAPERWLRVAFEPKAAQAAVDAVLQRYGLTAAVDPHRPAAEDPYLDVRGDFWNYYVSRRIPLVAARATDLGRLLTALNDEATVVWAHPFSLSPALDRGSRLVMRDIGKGWYQKVQLDSDLNMLVHLLRTTSREVVRGYAARARLELDGDRLPVIIEPQPGAATGDVAAAIGGAIDFQLGTDDGLRLYGVASLDAVWELADVPGVGMVRAKERHGS